MGRKAKNNIHIPNLKFYRQNSGLTQKQVADALHIERTTYTYYETGKTLPSIFTLMKLAKIYNVSVEQLMPNSAEEQLEVSDSDFSESQREENLTVYAVKKANNEKIYSLSNEEQNLIIRYRILPDKIKEEVTQTIENLTEKYIDSKE